MARIAGVDIPRDRCAVVSFTYTHGIGNTTAKKALANVGVSEDARVCDLTDEQTDAIRAEIDELKVERGLRREANLNIKHLTKIGPYRGIRHRRGLPTHGQNTKNNARTRRGPTKTVVGKKK